MNHLISWKKILNDISEIVVIDITELPGRMQLCYVSYQFVVFSTKKFFHNWIDFEKTDIAFQVAKHSCGNWNFSVTNTYTVNKYKNLIAWATKGSSKK
jgi:hypothetical protein